MLEVAAEAALEEEGALAEAIMAGVPAVGEEAATAALQSSPASLCL